jgi:hypothetical protein
MQSCLLAMAKLSVHAKIFPKSQAFLVVHSVARKMMVKETTNGATTLKTVTI